MRGRSLLLTIFVGLHCRLIQSKGPPTILEHFETVYRVKPGVELKLTCPIKADPEPLLTWLKDNDPITNEWDQYRLTGSTLKIKNVTDSDAGYFTCRATNGFGSETVTFHVVILGVGPGVEWELSLEKQHRGQDTYSDSKLDFVRPEFTDLTWAQPRLIHTQLGVPLKLSCEARGQPLPDIIWLKDKEVVAANERLIQDVRVSRKNLAISQLGISDAGIYTCLARNLNGVSNITFTLEISGDPASRKKPEISGLHPLNTTVRVGNGATLQCHVKSDMPPTIQWLKKIERDETFSLNDTIRLGDYQFRVLRGEKYAKTEDGIYLHQLVLPNVVWSDEGHYICLGANVMGYSFRQAYLEVRDTESIVTPFPLSLTIGLPLTFLAALVCWLRILKRRSQERQRDRNEMHPAISNSRDVDLYKGNAEPLMDSSKRRSPPGTPAQGDYFQRSPQYMQYPHVL